MTKKEFINLVADELEDGFSIENNNGKLSLKTIGDNGKPMVIAELTTDGIYHRYYTKNK